VDWENARFPGARGLRRRVAAECGRAAGFKDLDHRFSDWIAAGREAPQATVAAVEARIAAYLDQAAEVGRRWGTTRGFGFGLGLALLILAGFGIWTVLR